MIAGIGVAVGSDVDVGGIEVSVGRAGICVIGTVAGGEQAENKIRNKITER
jgi:hypothetical protein